MVITSLPRFWLQDLTKLPQPKQGKAPPKLRSTPLFDLVDIQQEVQSGRVSADDVVLVTEQARKDRRDRLPWTSSDLFHYIACLNPYKLGSAHDFKGAHWCLDSNGNWLACDSYAMRYDSQRRCRSAGGLDVYFKFSVDNQGGLVLLVISLHPPR